MSNSKHGFGPHGWIAAVHNNPALERARLYGLQAAQSTSQDRVLELLWLGFKPLKLVCFARLLGLLIYVLSDFTLMLAGVLILLNGEHHTGGAL